MSNIFKMLLGGDAPPVTDGALMIWGNGGSGQLGDGTTVDKSSPVQVGSLTTWVSVAGGEIHTMAIKTDGTLWAWGGNANGQLGDSTTVSKSSPVQVGALTTWSTTGVGHVFTLATKTDGTLWGIGGMNTSGQLGLGITTNQSSPTQIGALTTWLSVAAGQGHSMAVRTDGTLWTWGLNATGSLGHGTSGAAGSKSSPTQVGALTTWLEISGGNNNSASVKTDGTLWLWGRNNYGQLGDGTTVDKSSPVQVGALTTWAKVDLGSYYCLGLKTDGTLWAWGFNIHGQLGDGTTVSKSSPIQVGALTTWSDISAGTSYNAQSGAIKTDGTIWLWGRNNKGQLGDGTTVNKSSPIQVGALTTWLNVECSYETSGAI